MPSATIMPPDCRAKKIGADARAAVLDVHTDLRSPKVAALCAMPRAALHIWDQSAHLQIRISADVSILSGDAVAAIWEKVPDPSRNSYGTEPAPGQPIAAALDYSKPADPASFAVLRCTVQRMDILHLGLHQSSLFQKRLSFLQRFARQNRLWFQFPPRQR